MKNIAGQKFGHLTALYIDIDAVSTPVKWVCKCDCGEFKSIREDHLVRGETISCGCQHYNFGHGKSKTRLNRIWVAMRQRCNNPNANKYARYGGRGIKVCKEWDDNFLSFYEWSISHGYTDGLSIDRIDNDKGYSPDNCRWATVEQQSNNKSTTRRMVLCGESMSVTQAARKLGLEPNRVNTRLLRGWSIERAFEGKVDKWMLSANG